MQIINNIEIIDFHLFKKKHLVEVNKFEFKKMV